MFVRDNPCKKVLCVTLEPIGLKMAGPAIRCLELAKQLAEDFKVTVFSPQKVAEPYEEQLPAGLKLAAGQSKQNLYRIAQESDAVFIQANVLKSYPALQRFGKYIIVDLYDPYLFSLLAQYHDDAITGSSSYRLMHHVLAKHMIAADFAVCASEAQRDYWLGRFCALGRLTPQLYRIDPAMRMLIEVVPFGVPEQDPTHTRPAIRKITNGINQSDKLLLWGGGIWEWFDPLTVIKAVALVRSYIPNIRLFFMGVKSPNPQVPLMSIAEKAIKVSEELGLLNKHVFFSKTWASYEERVNYLLEADAAVSAHFDLVETRFSFRTRILDYLWAGVPVLTTVGDELAQLIERKEAGITLPYEDVNAWSQAICRVLLDANFHKKCGKNAREASQQFTWKKVVKPLHRFLSQPYHLPRYTKVTMPSLVERAHAVYARGGIDLVLERSGALLKNFL